MPEHLGLIENLAAKLGGAERIETHISSLLLTSDRVYKFKKPLDLGFLDFSTLEKRRIGCEDELRLNRRTAPELYLSVVEVHGTAADPNLDGEGPVLDYAVLMQRFDEADRLDHMLEDGRLLATHLDELADCVAAFHGRVERATGSQGCLQKVIGPMRTNFMELLSRAEAEPREQLARLGAWTERRFEALGELLEARQASGFVREGHGDLHLGNIALVEGRITPFDCIEFNADLRWVDVISDLAFLIMDLQDRGALAFSYRVLDRYLSTTGDYGGLTLMRFYQMYRAMVRAKVCAICMGQAGCEAQPIQEEYDGYMALAAAYLKPKHPRLILMHGVSASGKSWVSQALVEELGAVRLRSDRERQRIFGADASLYEPQNVQVVYDRLLELSEGVLRAGYTIIVDATFLSSEHRRPFANLTSRVRVPMTIVHTTANFETLQARLRQRAQEKGNISEATHQVLVDQLGALEPLGPAEPVVTWDTTTDQPISKLIGQLGWALE
ncbi:MAG: AAA family ATPase [bacterium]|nr:AAA family ATPase [bacterium]